MLPKDGTLNKAAAVRPLSDHLLTSVTCRARDTTFSRMRHAKHLILILVITLASAAVFASGQQVPLEEQNGGASSASEFLKQGTKAMASGRFADAISHFDDAILADPDNYLSYYRRATAALSLGRSGSAMSDFDKINQMNPKFPQAHLQKAKLLAKDGRLDRAKESVDQYVKLKKDDEEGKELKKTIEGATSNLKSLKKTKEGIDKILHSGKNITTDKTLPTKLEDCLKLASLVLEVSPSSLEARRDRADCALAKGEHEDAIADWTRIAHLAPSTNLLLRLSSLSYFVFGEKDSQGRDAGLLHVKTCLNSDPDNKVCAKAHKRIRAVEKALKKANGFVEGGKWKAVLSALKGAKVGGPTVIQEVEKAIQDDLTPAKEGEEAVLPAAFHDAMERSGLLFELNELHCQAHTELGELKKAMPYCRKVLQRDEGNKIALVASGEQHLVDEEYEEAVRDLRRAFEASGKQDASIHARLQKAEKRLKLSKTKDYYKVLGVSRNADQKEIQKAYRKMAREYHPDKGGTPEKMAEINEAFGVLKDPELRARFDQGDDPNDPMGGQQGGQGNPFAQGFGPQFFQGGGGSQFFQSGGFPGGGQFHFNF